MGMYTKVNLCLPIKKDIDENTKKILYSIFEGDGIDQLKEKGIDIPKHKFFNIESRIWFPNSGGSYYFTSTSNSWIKSDPLGNYAMVLHIDTDFKNYNNEIENFLDWICPYLDTVGRYFLGYSLYEEDLDPILYWFNYGEIIQFKNKNMEE